MRNVMGHDRASERSFRALKCRKCRNKVCSGTVQSGQNCSRMICLRIAVTFLLVQLCITGEADGAWKSQRAENKGGRYRIISGRVAGIMEFPYQASIEHYGQQWCGGAVIKKNIILTAAHCIEAVKDRNPVPQSIMQIRLGNDVATVGGQTYAIKKVIPHERYGQDPLVDEYDIAILVLKKSIKYSGKVKPINLTIEEPGDGQMSYVTGFGRQEPMRRRTPVKRHLMAVEIPIMNREKCKEIHKQFGNVVTDNMICAGYPSGSKDSCKGDSGGPLVSNEKLVGVVAWGIGCGREGIPGVYTSIAKMRNWIDEKLNLIKSEERKRRRSQWG